MGTHDEPRRRARADRGLLPPVPGSLSLTMTYRRLGRLPRPVSAVGFGTWPLGGAQELGGRAVGRGDVDEREATRAIEHALAAGINFFDTADSYGDGRAETLLGRVLDGARDVVVCSKFGNRRDASGHAVKDFGATWLDHSIDGILTRLRRARIDVLLLHSPPDDFEWSRYDCAPLEACKARGAIGAYGVSASVRGAAAALRAG